MLLQLTAAAGLITATVAIQALFFSSGLKAFNWVEENQPTLLTRRPTMTIVVCILYLLAPVILAVTLWAAFYYLQAALPTFEDALYFSAVTFTTVGYGDIVLGVEWRQLATFEAMSGWIVFGWMTAIIMTVIQRLYSRPHVGLRDTRAH